MDVLSYNDHQTPHNFEPPVDVDDENFDAVSVWLDRGAVLRKLRAMELQDEEERRRQEEEEEEKEKGSADNHKVKRHGTDVGGDTLQYNDYLSNQGYYDDYKHVNYRFIDFGILPTSYHHHHSTTNSTPHHIDSCVSLTSLESSTSTSTTSSSTTTTCSIAPTSLIVEQDRTVGKGGFIWDAGFILGEHVLHSKNDWLRGGGEGGGGEASSKTSIVELGAGTGITGFMIAKSLPTMTHVHLTDLPQLIPLLEKNRITTGCETNTTAVALPWGTGASKRIATATTTTTTTSNSGGNGQNNKTTSSSSSSSTTFDVIVGADVVASIYDLSALVETIYDLCHDESSHVYLSCKDRLLGTVEQLELQLKQFFQHVQHIQQPISQNKNPGVSILIATGKYSNQ